MLCAVSEEKQPLVKTEADSRSKPASRARLYDPNGADLSEQNLALYYAHELSDAVQLDQRISDCNVHTVYQCQARDLLHALALKDDRDFFRAMCDRPAEFPFMLRYAWLWCRFANCDEDEINPIFPTGRGFVDETHGTLCAGVAACKQDIADVLLQRGPFKYVDRARNLVAAAAEAETRHVAPTSKRAKVRVATAA